MNWTEKMNRQHILIAGLLITIGVLGRILLHDVFAGIPNPWSTTGFPVPLDVFFIIATLSLYAGVILGKFYTFVVPLCVIVLTDVFYGIVDPNSAALWMSWLFLFTWSGYAVIAVLGFMLKRKRLRTISYVPMLAGAGALGVLFYDIWTNFGFWLMYSKLGFYPQTIQGLATVYIGGLPTMVWHLLSTSLAIVSVGLPLLYLTKQKIVQKTIEVKPRELYLLLGATGILLLVSVFSAVV
ncbi:MAG: DUF6580 family putative transport protein [Methanobacteriota archaeon]